MDWDDDDLWLPYVRALPPRADWESPGMDWSCWSTKSAIHVHMHSTFRRLWTKPCGLHLTAGSPVHHAATMPTCHSRHGHSMGTGTSTSCCPAHSGLPLLIRPGPFAGAPGSRPQGFNFRRRARSRVKRPRHAAQDVRRCRARGFSYGPVHRALRMQRRPL